MTCLHYRLSAGEPLKDQPHLPGRACNPRTVGEGVESLLLWLIAHMCPTIQSPWHAFQ
jgi:hypothetical protein